MRLPKPIPGFYLERDDDPIQIGLSIACQLKIGNWVELKVGSS